MARLTDEELEELLDECRACLNHDVELGEPLVLLSAEDVRDALTELQAARKVVEAGEPLRDLLQEEARQQCFTWYTQGLPEAQDAFHRALDAYDQEISR